MTPPIASRPVPRQAGAGAMRCSPPCPRSHSRAAQRGSRRVLLAARLDDAAIVLDDDTARDAPSAERAAAILRTLAASGAHLVLLTHAVVTWSHALLDLPYARIEVGLPSAAERASLWRRAFASNGLAPQFLDPKAMNGGAVGAGDALVQSLADRFAIGPARIAAAAGSVTRATSSACLDPEGHAGQLAAQASVAPTMR